MQNSIVPAEWQLSRARQTTVFLILKYLGTVLCSVLGYRVNMIIFKTFVTSKMTRQMHPLAGIKKKVHYKSN